MHNDTTSKLSGLSLLLSLLFIFLFGCGEVIDAEELIDPGFSVRLTWQEPGDPDIYGYKVVWGTQSGVIAGSDFVVGANTYTTASNLTQGTTYYFRVKTYDTSGNPSIFSNEESAYIPTTP